MYKDVPEVLSTAVKEGLRLAKSVSIDPVKMKIRHIGLLGADQPPAVAGLGAASFAAVDDNVTYVFNQKKEEPSVDPKDKKIEDLENEIKTLKDKISGDETKQKLDHAEKALADEKSAHQKTRDEFSAYKSETEEKALKSRIDALSETGRIKPAEKDDVLAFAKALPDTDATMEFAAPDGKKEKVSPREKYIRDFEARKADQGGLLSEFATADHAGTKKEAGTAFKDVNQFA